MKDSLDRLLARILHIDFSCNRRRYDKPGDEQARCSVGQQTVSMENSWTLGKDCWLVAFEALISVFSVFMDLSQLSQDQFKELVRGIVDDRLRELVGDPDLGLQLDNGLRARLKESMSSTERISGEDIAHQLGLRW